MQKRLELLPEETLYLVEKGALQCWRAVEDFEPRETELDGAMFGAPMSVQEAFSEMIGKEGMTLERYQVSINTTSIGSISQAIHRCTRTLSGWGTP